MDTVPRGADLAGKRWWMALRRAYGVPDIVTDDGALTHVAASITGSPSATVGIDDSHTAGAMTAWLVTDLGEHGELDGVLLGDEATGPEAICRNGASRCPGNIKLQDNTGSLSIDVVRKVCEYVKKHPYEN